MSSTTRRVTTSICVVVYARSKSAKKVNKIGFHAKNTQSHDYFEVLKEKGHSVRDDESLFSCRRHCARDVASVQCTRGARGARAVYVGVCV